MLLLEMESTVGRIMMERMIQAASSPIPLPPPAIGSNSGMSTIMPKSPKRMEGMPASRLTSWEKKPLTGFGQNFARYTAPKMPKMPPKNVAPAVVYRVPTIMGSSPYSPPSGNHLLPKIKLKTPISRSAGMLATSR